MAHNNETYNNEEENMFTEDEYDSDDNKSLPDISTIASSFVYNTENDDETAEQHTNKSQFKQKKFNGVPISKDDIKKPNKVL